MSLTGCIRGEAEVYLVAEVIFLELAETGAVKEFDEASGLKMLDLTGKKPGRAATGTGGGPDKDGLS